MPDRRQSFGSLHQLYLFLQKYTNIMGIVIVNNKRGAYYTWGACVFSAFQLRFWFFKKIDAVCQFCRLRRFLEMDVQGFLLLFVTRSFLAPVSCSKQLMNLVQMNNVNERSISFYTFNLCLSSHPVDSWERLRLFLPLDQDRESLTRIVRVWHHTCCFILSKQFFESLETLHDFDKDTNPFLFEETCKYKRVFT